MISLQIISPERALYSDTVDSVTLPTFDGEITILPHHIPLITALKAGVVKLKKGNADMYFSVSTGIVKVDESGIVVLADTAERADELVEEKVEKAREDAQKAMQEKHVDSEEFVRALAIMERETARLKAIRRHRSSSGMHITSDNNSLL